MRQQLPLIHETKEDRERRTIARKARQAARRTLYGWINRNGSDSVRNLSGLETEEMARTDLMLWATESYDQGFQDRWCSAWEGEWNRLLAIGTRAVRKGY